MSADKEPSSSALLPEAAWNFRVVCIALTCALIVHSMLLVAVPVYALKLGASPLMLGVVFSAPYLLPLLLAIPLGGMVTRYGGRALIIAGTVTMVAGLLLIIAFPGYGGLLLGQLLIGMGQLQMVLAGQSVISSLGTGPVLERYFGWYTTWLSGGQVVGPLIAGALIDFSGTTRPAFVSMLGVVLVSALLASMLSGAARRGIRVNRKDNGFRAQARLLKSSSGVQVALAVTITSIFGLSIHGSYLPAYLGSLDVTASTIGILVSVRATASMLIRPFIAPVIAGLGGRQMAMLVSLAALAMGLVFLGFSEHALLIAVFSILVGAGCGLLQPLSIVILAENVGDEQRSGALGMRMMANRGINFLAPLLFGGMLQIGGFGTAFFVAGVVVASAGYLMFRFLQRIENGK